MKNNFKIEKWVLMALFSICSIFTYAQTQDTDLSTHEPMAIPSGASFEWREGPMPSSDLVGTPTAVQPGLYYGYFNFGDDCFSEPSPISIVTNICPTTTVDLNTAVADDQPAGSIVSFHNDLPISEANEITGTDITEAVTGATYYLAFKTEDADGSACYSEGSPIVAATTDCTPNTTDAIDDINNTLVNTPVPGNVLTNDEDVQGDEQTVTENTDPSNGDVIVSPNGDYVYTPDPGFTGEDSFTYTICDDGNPQACDEANVVIEVLPSNDPENNPPVANNDTQTTEVDEPVVIDVLPNDFDQDGDDITVTPGSLSDPANGDVVLNPDGTVTYTPDPGFEGEDTFTYQICDDGNPVLCDEATVTVTITPELLENVTYANDDAYTGSIDTPIPGSVLDNDEDPEGDDQTVNTTPVVDPEHGTVVLNEDGTFVYTPDAGYTGPDSYVYSLCDDGTPQACDEATVILTITPDNTTDAIDDINNTLVNTPVPGNVLTNDEDPEGDDQTVTENTDPSNGDVIVSPNGDYVYTPDPDFTGEDSFTYTICDDGNPQACDEANVVIEVLPSNDPENNPPVANNDTQTTEVDEPVVIDVLPNDFDQDGDDITVTPGSLSDPENGDVVLNPDGTVTYTPDPGFEGEDTFTYQICDDGNPVLCDEATVTVTITPELLENVTYANDDAYTGTIDTPIPGSVLDNDEDPEGDDQTVNTTPVVDPEHGTVVLNEDGTFVYTPDAGYTGPDSYVYSLCDDGTPQACDEATVILTITPDNTTDAIDDINNTLVNTPVPGNVLTNDEDPEGDDQTVTENTDPSNGDVIVSPNGDYVYTPDPDFTGEDSFTYTICDDGNPQACDEANVVIEVLPSNDPANNPPVANNDTQTTEVDEPVVIDVLPNDFDQDGDDITVTPGSLSDPENGDVVLNPDGTVTYTPDPGFEGEDTFTYQICDDGNPVLCDEATVTVTITPELLENVTYANDDAYTGTIDTPIPGSVLDNDEDPEGDDQTVNTTPVVDPEHGTVVLNEDGTFVYTPDAGYTGPDSYVYSLCDDGTPQACDEATVILTITPDNTTDAIDDINNTLVNTPVPGNVLTNDEDPEGDDQTVTENTDPSNGDVIVSPNGDYVYTPDPDFTGEDSFTYTICDDGNPQACDEATVVIEVLPSNDPANNPPVANNDTQTTEVDEPVVIDVLPNDFDQDGDDITVTPGSLSDPENGDVVLNPDGTVTYTPDPGFEGEDTFTYQICDDGNPVLCDEATVTVTITPELLENVTYANDDAYNGEFNTPIPGSVLDNDEDPEGDDQTVNTTPVVDPEHGTVVLNEDGTFVYTPDAGYAGPDSYVYSLCDDGTPQACDEATVILTINAGPDDPCDANSAFYLTADCDGDGVPNGDELTPPNGEAPTDPTNPCDFIVSDITLTPSSAFLADDCDGDGVPNGNELTPPDGEAPTDPLDPCDFVTADITLTPSSAFLADDCDGDGVPNGDELTPPGGEAPTDPQDPCDFVTADITLTPSAAFLADDCDGDGVPNGDELTPPGGEAPTDPQDPCDFVTADITLAPDAAFLADDCDGDGVTNGDELTPPDGEAPTDPQDPCDFIAADITVQVTANEICNTTDAVNDQYIGQLNTPVTGNVTDNDEDPEGDDQIVNTTPVQQPFNGSVVLNPDGSFVYTPNPGFTGNDVFVYELCDDGTPVACDEATVSLAINGPDNPCDANAASYLTADCDGDGVPNGDELNPPNGEAPTDPTNPCDFIASDITLTPSAAFLADDCDGDGVPNGNELTPPDGEAPTDPLDPCDFVTADITLTPSSAFLADDCDGDGVPNGNELTPPDGETPTDPQDPCDFVTADITLTPDATFLADDCDGDGVTNGDELTPPDGEAPTDPQDPCDFIASDITVQITANEICNTTDAVNDQYIGQLNTPVTGNVTDNDEDPEGDDQIVNTTPVQQPLNGSVVLNPDGSFVYTPNPGFTGNDSFVYSVCDDGTPQACDEATVTLAINPSTGCSVTPGNCSITITGLDGSDYAKVFDSSWSIIWDCNPWVDGGCSSTETITNLPAGTYYVQACGVTEAYTVSCGAAPMPTLSVGDVTVNEADGTASVAITLSETSTTPTTVTYTTNPGSALAGSDYTPVTMTAVIPAGQTTVNVTIPIVNDNVEEPTENFTVELSNPNGATIADGTGTVTILDDDVPAGCSVTPGNCSITITGLDGTDYAKVFDSSWSIIWDCNPWVNGGCSSTETITNLPAGTYYVQACGDTEAYTVSCGGGPMPTLSVGDVTVNEADGTASVAITLSEPSTTATSVTYTTNPGSALAGSDYTPVTMTAVIPAGQTTVNVTIPIVNDNVEEPTENFTVELSNPNGATIADGTGTVTILDDDVPAGCSVTTGNCSITITGLDGSDYAKVFDSSWNIIWECNPWANGGCSSTETITNLPAGTYYVQACGDTEGYTVTCGGTTGCDNVTYGGLIEGDEVLCPGDDAGLITNLASPSGGTGDLEYIWLVSTTGCPNALSQVIPHANDATFDPGPLTTTTYYRRCSRRVNCTSSDAWLAGESNCVVKTVKDVGQCEEETNDCSDLYTAGNGVITLNNITAPIVSVHIFDSSWNSVFNCNSWGGTGCTPGAIAMPSVGTFWVRIQTYEDWNTPICDITESVEVYYLALTSNNLLELTATKNRGEVDLNWYNDSENAVSSHFELEHSNDGENFINIDEVSVDNESRSVRSYSTIDEQPVIGYNYYRVKLIYNDGSFIYSNVSQVSIDDLGEFGIYPNPASEVVNISLRGYEDANIEIQLINQLGGLVKTVSIPNASDAATYTMSLDNFNSGFYTVRLLIDGKKSISKKLIVAKTH